MKSTLFAVMLLLSASVAVAQDRTRPQEEEEKAYCRFVIEQAKATSTLLRTPNADFGVTQPSTGTTPQTYIGVTGSLSDLRKAGLTDKVALSTCALFVVQANAVDTIKYAMPSLNRTADAHRAQAINMGIAKLDALIAQNAKLVNSGNATKLGLYELDEARTRLLTERYKLQMQGAGMYIPEVSSVPLYMQVADSLRETSKNQNDQVKLAKQSDWDIRWQAGVHRSISGLGPVTNTVGSNTYGGYLGFDVTYNIGARKANKQLDAAAKDYMRYKKLDESDVAQGADELQAVLLNEIMIADRKLAQIADQRTKLDENIAVVKDANTPTAQVFLNQLNADDVTLQVELTDTKYRRQLFVDFLARNFQHNFDANRGSMVSLTFDDGYESAYSIALPIVEKAGMKATYYLITDDFGKKSYITSDNAKDIAVRGHEVGSHSVHHKHLPTLSLAEQESEIGGSLPAFAELGLHPTTFAYPFGERNDDSIKAVRDAGFKGARTVDRNAPDGDKYQLSSLSLTKDTTIGELKVAIDNARRDGTWLILTFHRFDEGDNEYSVQHSTLQWVVDYLNKTNTKVVTVDEGLGTTSSLGSDDKQRQAPVPAAKGPLVLTPVKPLF